MSKTILKEAVGDLYTNPKVDLEVHVTDLDSANGEDIQVDDTIPVQFAIEIDHRSWGIKGIDVFPRGTAEFHLEITAPGQDDYDAPVFEKDISIDLSNAEVEYQAGHAYTPASVEVEMNRKGEVQKTLITFYYISE